MISISTRKHEFELHLKFSTAFIQRAISFAASLLSFSDVREIEKRKFEELHRAGIHFI